MPQASHGLLALFEKQCESVNYERRLDILLNESYLFFESWFGRFRKCHSSPNQVVHYMTETSYFLATRSKAVPKDAMRCK